MSRDHHSTLDHDRQQRQGFPEVVYCQSKTAEQIAENLQALAESNGCALGTRVPTDRIDEILKLVPAANYDTLSNTITLGKSPHSHPSPDQARVAVISAGTSDLPISMEAAVTLEFLGHPVTRFNDIGVAGIHRSPSA